MSDWIIDFIETSGYIGVFVLMVLENVFPPIPSEVVLPMAGYLSSQGAMHPVPLTILATLGTTVGNYILYFLALKLGHERLKRFVESHGRWVAVSSEEVDKSSRWFKKHGKTSVFFARFVPGLRSLISLPAGLTHMPLVSFLVLTTVASAIWTVVLLSLGYVLGAQFESASEWLGYAGNAVFAGIFVLYLYRVLFGFAGNQRSQKANRS